MTRFLTNIAVETALLLAPWPVFCAIGYAIGGVTGLLLAMIPPALISMLSRMYALSAVLAQHRAQPILPFDAPGLYRLTAELCHRARVPLPKLFVMPEETPQVFAASGRFNDGAIVLSRGLFRTLHQDELASLIAHAVGQLRRGDLVPMTLAAGLSLWIGFAPITAALVRLTMRSSRWLMLDEESCYLSGDTLPLQTALWKIALANSASPLISASPSTAHLFILNPVFGKSRLRYFQIQPSLAKRLRHLKALRMNGGNFSNVKPVDKLMKASRISHS